ncbi:MAG TPA: LPS export ABC transporter periplasmic protein LptC [Longimicrobiales bacterium]|nr:LPS export ABC transporter periplasmic protein LptC [Longimicrobiales bacterium]
MLRNNVFAVLVSGALAGVALMGCSQRENPVSEGALSLPADQVMSDVQYDVRDLGVLRARLFADTAYVYEDSSKVRMRPVRLTLFDQEGKQAAHLTALQGTMDTRTQAMVAKGHVVLVTEDGNRRIETEELHYDPRADMIWSDLKTTYTEGETKVVGDGFTSDGRMDDVRVKNGKAQNLKIEM